jgi:hypothetical protein
MTGAMFIMLFLLCGPTEMFCEEGRMTHPSCAAAEALLRAGLRPDQTLLVSAREATEGKGAPAFVLYRNNNRKLRA